MACEFARRIAAGHEQSWPVRLLGGLVEFVGTFWALVPPLVAIVLALITKETYSSLFVGIVVGALLLASFNPVDTLNYIICGTFGA